MKTAIQKCSIKKLIMSTIYLFMKKKHNYKFNNRNKKQWNKSIIRKKYNYKMVNQNKKQWNKSIRRKGHNYKTINQNKRQWKRPIIGKK